MRNRWVYLSAAFASVAVLALGLALAFRSADIERLAEGRQANCHAIEAIKTQLREDARSSFAGLDRSLRLLGIAKTPEIVSAARESRDRKLRHFAATEC